MKLISSYIKPLWFSIIIVSLLSLLNVAGTLYIPTLTATIINDGVLHGDLEMITNSSATMLIVALLTVLSAILGVAMSAHISASIGKVLRDNLVKAIQAFHYATLHTLVQAPYSCGPAETLRKFNQF